MAFTKAERRQAFLKLALTGPSGAGKTMSALLMASGLGGRIALIDTENRSASLYADRFAFDTEVIEPPFTVEKYLRAIREAVKEKYDVLIIDSITHAWKGTGGLLEQKEAMDMRGKNSFTNWAAISKLHAQFMSELIQSQIHLIVTMRSKQDYVMAEKDGKQVPKKVGLAPEQREGVEYEFSLVLDLAMSHLAEASKDRTSLFDGQIFVPTKETGVRLLNWLNTGALPIIDLEKKKSGALTKGDHDHIKTLAKNRNWTGEELMRFVKHRYFQEQISNITRVEFDELCAYVDQHPMEKSPEEKAADAVDLGAKPNPSGNGKGAHP